MTLPHNMLARLRAETGSEQMAVFAEALVERNETPQFKDMPWVAAAYVLGRVDALEKDAPEINGSGGPMAKRVLIERGLLFDGERTTLGRDDVPF